MNDGFLSQEEIDALLKGGDTPSSPPATQAAQAELTDIEKDALGEIGNISMGSAATSLSILLGRRVSITTPKVSISTLEEIQNQYPLPYLVIEVGYTQGINGTNLLAVRENDSLIIADLMMGNDGTNPPGELSELYMSAVGEAMNQMMGSVATSMSTIFKKKIDISPPVVNLVDFATSKDISTMAAKSESVVRVAFRMEVENLIDSEIMQILPVDVAKEMVDSLMNVVQAESAAPPAPAKPAPQSAPAMAATAPQSQPAAAYAQQAAAAVAMAPKQAVASNVTVQPVQFAPLVQPSLTVGETNIGLLLDVPLQVTVELGRTRKLIREILELTPGAVIELDKLAGEPVDILANGKLIAKGEVVVIDENFGVRITDIISPLERAVNLQ
ncbi:flagellar motor switch phosphatase FliY [Propionispora vibrioides]|uniref:Flagellar motor switch protein FliN/FliY n=1 Tax=Propionispora vibrioides TaxID=112903 RepID=A0A1H8SQX0_9FIRM|nr:flagellar motor switch phosphatase FliY [Propionispora vibrioides]SEO81170.1 flagellar motor switch protein FliN/FliY [Propionispora vibrioides]